MQPTEPLKRTHYFDGQLLSTEDMVREQEYFRERLRRHNRALHGWGVVCGLAVDTVADIDTATRSATLTVSPGYALSPAGDEIVVGELVSRPLALTQRRWIVAARYDERLVDPVPSPADTHAEDAVEFTAIEETYVVDVFEASQYAPDDQWVVLAMVEVGQSGQIAIDTSSRQHVRSHRSHRPEREQ